MKKRIIPALLALCLLLSGCAGLLSGEIVYTRPHVNDSISPEAQTVRAENYSQLYAALVQMVADGREQGVILVTAYASDSAESDAQTAVQELMARDPVAAYAVSHIRVETGTTGGEDALAVNIFYLRDLAELRRIDEVNNVETAIAKIRAAVNYYETGLVLKINAYEPVDFVQAVEDYALEYPEYVIEEPWVTVNVYPDSGTVRVVEVKFTYENSRDALKTMQSSVRGMYTSASLYVSADTNDLDILSHLYTFLMERFDYTFETSITPAYSLLMHGVGDDRAFATVYASMCAREGVECRVVTGTHDGEVYYWNIVCVDGSYYHVDLLRCSAEGAFTLMTDTDMTGYVWDYYAYPACVG